MSVAFKSDGGTSQKMGKSSFLSMNLLAEQIPEINSLRNDQLSADIGFDNLLTTPT
jgi:hypothetical protein